MLQIVIPMAGLGQRYIDAGFHLPKPLIPIGGKPMVVRVVENLPAHDRLIFVCNRQHVTQHQIDTVIKQYYPNAVFVVTDGLTAGQACTTELAMGHLQIEHPVLVAACDSTQIYDPIVWQQMVGNPHVDYCLWTFNNDPVVLRRPQAWGWLQEDNGNITTVSVKKPISNNLLEDRVITGTFWFRSARVLRVGIQSLIRMNLTVNNEYYLDSIHQALAQIGYHGCAFPLAKYISWGTPEDYSEYTKWEQHFSKRWAA